MNCAVCTYLVHNEGRSSAQEAVTIVNGHATCHSHFAFAVINSDIRRINWIPGDAREPRHP